MKRIHAIVLALGLVIAGAWTAPARGQTKDVVEGAKKEGKVVFYTSLTLQEIEQVVFPFLKKYPFLKVDPFRGNSEQLLQKIAIEARAGRPQHDVALFDAFEEWQLQKLGLLQPYKSPEAKNFPDAYKDADGYWTAVYLNYIVLGYNPKAVKESELPKKWEDLLQPQWKGAKFAMDRDEGVWYGGLSFYWGKEKTEKFIKALAAQDPSMRKGHTLIATLLSSGEFPLGLVYAHRIEEMKSKGMTTIDWTPLDPIVVTPNLVAMGKGTVHPNAAKLLIDFMLSVEGQTILQKQQFRTPANPDLPPTSAKMDPKQLKLFVADKRVADQHEKFAKDFYDLFVKGKPEQ
ncbi:MAG TPA: extracellular solute-binding protein [Candidatus Binatia bacterium]|nr:extracellular solute-binding protein [Candidatus Binatia bacterium]